MGNLARYIVTMIMNVRDNWLQKFFVEDIQSKKITVDTALMLAKVFGNTANFWLNLQQRNDIWAALHSPKRMEKIERVSPIREAIA